MALPPEVALALRYTTRYNRLRLAAGVAVGNAWDRLAGLDDAAQQRFAVEAAATSMAAQERAAALVGGYLSVAVGFMDGDGSPVGVDVERVSGAAVRGVDPADVYLRGVVTARTKVSAGVTVFDAMRAGRDRMVSTAETDVALTQRAATVEVLGEKGVVGYRRVLTGKSCALCATASTQRYRSGDLMPIHSHCDCGVVPIIGDRDPGRVINQPLLDDLKNADPDFARSRKLQVDEDGTVHLPEVAVREHGELGPVLSVKDQDFTGPGDIAA